MHSQWEPLPSDVADWMGLDPIACPVATVVPAPVQPDAPKQGFAALLERLRHRLAF